MNIRKVRNIFLVVALLSVVSLISFNIGRSGISTSDISNNKLDLSLMWRVRDKLTQLYLDKNKLNDQDMSYGAIKGMVDALGDPYTVFLPPSDNKSSNEDLAGEFGGVGISLGFRENTLAVMSPLPKSPAENAGVRAGDLILKIVDSKKGVDKDTSGISLDEAVSLIRGPVGSEVTLKMFREGKPESYDVVLKRDNIVVPSIETEIKEVGGKKIAWIKLYKFTERLYEEWNDTVEKVIIESEKPNFGGVVLDLRNNPGGYLQASVMVASDFMKEGLVVTQESTNGKKEDYRVDKSKGRLSGQKLVVLVNGGSASAAEILAGAIKENGRAKLVGEKTFGKGTVQQPENFSDGSGLHVTIAKWLLPNGKNIHNEGVLPDVEIKYLPDEKDLKFDNQFEKAVEELRKL